MAKSVTVFDVRSKFSQYKFPSMITMNRLDKVKFDRSEKNIFKWLR